MGVDEKSRQKADVPARDSACGFKDGVEEKEKKQRGRKKYTSQKRFMKHLENSQLGKAQVGCSGLLYVQE